MTGRIRARKQFKDFTWELDFSFANEITILFGPSGSGKSLTLDCLAGLLAPDEGEITLGSQVFLDSRRGIHLKPQAREVSYVFQNHALFPHLNLRENILFGAKYLSAAEKQERCEQLLTRTKLSAKAHLYPQQISGGEQQRAALARAIIRKPKLLLLDESFSSLDSLTRFEMQQLLLELQEELKIPVIFVTHDIYEARVLGQKMVILDQGKILQSGSLEQLRQHPRSEMIRRLLALQPSTFT